MSRVMKAVPLVVLCALIIAVPSVWAYWAQDGVALCTATGIQQLPQIASDGAGGAIATWRDDRSGNPDIYAQRVNASGAVQWAANGVAVCAATGIQFNSAIISDGAGGAIITWEDFRSGNWDIYAQRVSASGDVQWTANGVALCAATGGQTSPAIASDGAGGAIVTWQDHRGITDDIFAQRVSASGAVQWKADGVIICTAMGDQYSLSITSDGAGGAVATWQDGRNGDLIIRDIYAQRVNASGAVQWTTDGVRLCRSAGGADAEGIASDGAGGAIVIWRDYRSGNYDIYARRVNASGAVQWTSNGVALCTAARDQDTPTIVSDGAGGAIVTWRDNRSGSDDSLKYDIYAQRVSTSGAVQWTTDGVALCTAARDQDTPAIVSDGAGGAIVTWRDNRSGGNYSFRYDIYAQRVSASGDVQWSANGVALCAATGSQTSPAIVSDSLGGAIVAWDDLRSGYRDIYGRRVDPYGYSSSDAPAVPIELHQNYPNPFNPATMVTYSVPEKCSVTLKIYDVSGRCIASLVDGQQEKGSHAVEWNGRDKKGNSVASGIYLYRLAAGNQTISRKMVLLK